eukprot:763863-Hanusia_phi.AAC.1
MYDGVLGRCFHDGVSSLRKLHTPSLLKLRQLVCDVIVPASLSAASHTLKSDTPPCKKLLFHQHVLAHLCSNLQVQRVQRYETTCLWDSTGADTSVSLLMEEKNCWISATTTSH